MWLHKCLFKPSLSRSLPKGAMDGSNAYSRSFVLGETITLFSAASVLADPPHSTQGFSRPLLAMFWFLSACLFSNCHLSIHAVGPHNPPCMSLRSHSMDCSSFISVTVIKQTSKQTKSNFREREVYLSSQFQGTVFHCGEIQGGNFKWLVTSHSQSRLERSKCLHTGLLASSLVLS